MRKGPNFEGSLLGVLSPGLGRLMLDMLDVLVEALE
jgi:hypothetical protein